CDFRSLRKCAPIANVSSKSCISGSDTYMHKLVDSSDEIAGVKKSGVDGDDVLRLRRWWVVTPARSAGKLVNALVSGYMSKCTLSIEVLAACHDSQSGPRCS